MTKEIPLTQGKVVLVDDEDYDWLSRFKWYYSAVGYACRSTWDGEKRGREYMHRAIMGDPDGIVDHINRDTLCNTRANLRVTDRSGNGLNGNPKKNNKTGVIGVSFDPRRKKWSARIQIARRTIHLGRFATFEAAVQARQRAEAPYR